MAIMVDSNIIHYTDSFHRASVLGYANFGKNPNFHLLPFAVQQTNDRE